MHTDNFQKVLGNYFLLVVFLGSFLVTIVSTILSALPAAAASPSAVWVFKQETCTNDGAQAHAFLRYTDASGKTSDFHCFSINGNNPLTGTGGGTVMVLHGPNAPAPCDLPETIQVGDATGVPLNNATSATLTIPTSQGGLGCTQAQQTIAINPPAYANVTGTSAGPPAPGSTGGGSSTNPADPTNSGQCLIGPPLAWIACPILDILQGAITVLANALENMLYTPIDRLISSTRVAFDTFRNIALAFLVVAGLVMVVSQAMGMEIFAAYTIRKVLPRIVIAAIGISIALPILQIVVTFFNDIGLGVYQIIVGTLTVSAGNGASLNQAGTNFVAIVLGLVVSISAVVGSAGIVLSLITTLLVTLLIGFLVLAIRQMVILLAIIFAPLAIAASVLPGTYKLWDFWEDTLLGALLMFPIIMAFLGAGVAMSNIAQSIAKGASPGDAITWTIISVFSMFGALALVPFAFKLARGLVGTAHSIIAGNTMSKGFFAGQAKFRQERTAKRVHDAKSGNFIRPKNRFARAINEKAWGVTNIGEAGADPRRWKSMMHEAEKRNSFNEAVELAEKNPEWGAIAGDNNAIKATNMLAKGTSNAEVTNWLRGQLVKKDDFGNTVLDANGHAVVEEDQVQSAMTRAIRASRTGSTQAVELASLIADVQSGTGWKDTTDASGREIPAAEQMFKDIASATHGDAALQGRVWAKMRGDGIRTGRADLFGAGFNTGYQQIRNASTNATIDTNKVLVEAFLENSANSILNGKSYSTEAILNAASQTLQELQGKEGEQNEKYAREIAEKLAQIPTGILNAQRNGVYVSPHASYIVQQAFASLPEATRAKLEEAQRQQGQSNYPQPLPEDIANGPGGPGDAGH